MMKVDRHIRLDGLWYSAPAQALNAEGDSVLICAASIAQMESWEWGIDREGRPYEEHQWLENDFSRMKTIAAPSPGENCWKR